VVDPLFWLVLSFVLVAVSLTTILLVMVPAMRELGRAARSVEKLCDTISRELPPTLESIRLTSLEITELTDDVTEGVQSAGQVVQQVDESLSTLRNQAQRVQVGSRSLMTGMRVAWRTFTGSGNGRDRRRRAPSAPKPTPRLKQGTAPTAHYGSPENALTRHGEPLSHNGQGEVPSPPRAPQMPATPSQESPSTID
jgi:uncharacterized protein YoxC